MNQVNEPGKRGGEKYMSFFDHLEELRGRLFRSIAAIALGSIAAGIFHKRIFFAITQSVPELYWHTPLEPYFTFLKIAVVAGIFVSFPYVLYELWQFVSPGLYRKEKKYLLPFIISSWALFVLGAVFVLLVMLPFIASYLYGAGQFESAQAPRTLEQRWETVAEAWVAVQAEPWDATATARLGQLRQRIEQDLESVRSETGGQTRVGNVWSVGRYVHLALMLFLAFGLAFDMPVVIVVLTLMGVVKPATLGKARPVVLVVVFICAAILTPPDPVSQMMMGVPMYLLFEISLVVSRILLWMKREKKTAA